MWIQRCGFSRINIQAPIVCADLGQFNSILGNKKHMISAQITVELGALYFSTFTLLSNFESQPWWGAITQPPSSTYYPIHILVSFKTQKLGSVPTFTFPIEEMNLTGYREKQWSGT
jgi:hypothetical protein